MDGNGLTDEDGLFLKTDTNVFAIWHSSSSSSSSVHLALVNMHITEKGFGRGVLIGVVCRSTGTRHDNDKTTIFSSQE